MTSIGVIKFDGTSLKDIAAMRQSVSHVSKYMDDYIVVVASAMTGVNNVLAAMTDALKNQNKDYVAYFSKIEDRHLKMAEDLHLAAKDFSDLKNQLGLLRNLMLQISNNKKIAQSEIDRIMAFGELLSSLLLRDVFEEQKKNTAWFDIRRVIKTDENFGNARPDLVWTEELVKGQLFPELKKAKIIVTQGSLGETKKGQTTIIGPGGTDLGAIILGSAAQAKQIDLYTDVDPILSADQRLVPEAQPIDEITFNEAAELSYYLEKSLHPVILSPALIKEVPVFLKNPHYAKNKGTLLVAKTQPGSGVRSIVFKKGITLINITSFDMLGSHGFLNKVFRIFEKHKTAVDMISTSEISLSVTISDYRKLIAICEEIGHFARVEIFDKQAMIAVIGSNIRNKPGFAARIFGAIKDINVNIISQGANQTNLSFMIDESHLEKALNALHKEMIETRSAAIL